jgi:hypothetical protein
VLKNGRVEADDTKLSCLVAMIYEQQVSSFTVMEITDRCHARFAIVGKRQPAELGPGKLAQRSCQVIRVP